MLNTEHVLRDYRAALKKLEARNSQIRVEGSRHTSYKITRSGSPQEPRKAESLISYVLSNDCEKYCLVKEESGKYLDRVVVRAGDREFGLRRGSPGESYYLEQERLGGSVKELLKERRGVIANCEFCVNGRVDWPSKIQSPAFHITAAFREASGEKTFYRIEFRDSDEKGEREGWFHVDPQEGWRLQDYLVKTRLSGNAKAALLTDSGSIAYRSADGSITPATIVNHRTIELPDRKIEEDDEFRATKWILAPTPRDEFTLAFYGLGDFERSGAQRGSRTAYIAAGVGGACLLISAVLAGIVRSRSRARS